MTTEDPSASSEPSDGAPTAVRSAAEEKKALRKAEEARAIRSILWATAAVGLPLVAGFVLYGLDIFFHVNTEEWVKPLIPLSILSIFFLVYLMSTRKG